MQSEPESTTLSRGDRYPERPRILRIPSSRCQKLGDLARIIITGSAPSPSVAFMFPLVLNPSMQGHLEGYTNVLRIATFGTEPSVRSLRNGAFGAPRFDSVTFFVTQRPFVG